MSHLRLVGHDLKMSERITADEFRRRMYAGTEKKLPGSKLGIKTTDLLTGKVGVVYIDAGTQVELLWWEQ